MLIGLLTVVLIGDLSFSYLQYLNTPIDGDFTGGVLPSEEVRVILDDPLGWAVLGGGAHANPNRYFCHAAFYYYFNRVPLLLQHFMGPVASLYHASAIAKLFTKLGLLVVMGVALVGRPARKFTVFLGGICLMVPLFQANGYRSYMGVIDPAVTYTFFYALPLLWLLVYFLPLFLARYHGRALGGSMCWAKYLWWPLSVVVALSGALNPGIALIVVALFGTDALLRGRRRGVGVRLLLADLEKRELFYLLPITVASVYSLYVGTHDTIGNAYDVPLTTRYALLPHGIFDTLTAKIGYPLLIVGVVVNRLLLRAYDDRAAQKLKTLAGWFAAFCLLYLLLLPLGGYRPYRPGIVRYDTIMPITLGLIYLFAASSVSLLQTYRATPLRAYVLGLLVFSCVFWNADRGELERDDCQRTALLRLSRAGVGVIKIEQDCNVLFWAPIRDPRQSELNAELLRKLRVTSGRVLYFQ